MRKHWPLIVAALCTLALGAALGYWTASSRYTPEDTTPAVEQRQGDGSLVLARDPEPPSVAPHRIPAKAIEERRVAVTVQPKAPDCPPVRIDLSLIREAAGRRVIASSPDGQVIAGVDVPIESGIVPAHRPWATGASYSVTRESYGVWLERDVGRIRLGVEVAQDRLGGAEFRVRAGWVF